MSDAFVQTTQLTKRYGSRTAVNQINLELNKQDIYGFLGPNGAGKTTTIRMLLGLIRPTSGSIRMFGKSFPKSRMDVLKKVGSLVESPSYYGHLNACENLETIRRIIDVPAARIDEVLSIVGLTKDAKRVVKGYSLGMRQRLGIAAALLGSPELLILDEPTNGLDPAGILEMRELIKSLPDQYGITVLVSSHLLSEIEQMANRVGIIQHGSILFQDSLEMLQRQAKHHIRLAVSDPRQAAHTISTWGIHAAQHEDLLTISYVPNEQVALIVQQLVQNGHSIYRIVDQRQSLEEIFLSLTGKERS
ncbi:ABC transporter ATP-binding protein [Paenibacillus taiwanensis]|uniref:ABC transporter ATP-binding protein n=1 Tax=Paenibacillus taiwanensis TaxID=401638 RepID=UPI0003F9A320|nr:ABC transporter ATP-binding protein [Paenibacillus taiwanensis]